MIYLGFIIWLILGIHSMHYFLKSYMGTGLNFELSRFPNLVVCFLFPIISHYAIYSAYVKPFKVVNDKDNILTLEQEEKAHRYYDKHRNEINEKAQKNISELGVLTTLKNREAMDNPELWTPAQWNWFLSIHC